MKQLVLKVKYYVSLWKEFLSMQIKREISFRSSFLLEVVSYIFWFVFNIFFFSVIFSHRKSIGGWGPYEVLTLVSINQLIVALYDSFLGPNLRRFQTYIERGDFDTFLIKPIDLQFFVSTRFVELKPLFSMPVAIITLIFALSMRGIPPGAFEILMFFLSFLIGLVIRYGLGFLVMSLSFYFVRISALHSLQRELLSFAGYPISIYEKFAKVFFTFILPVALIANLPAQALLKYRISCGIFLYSCFFAVFILIFSRKFFNQAIRRYESASS
uniref:ABC transporter permease n=1 Tax=candidate division WOR-3 bacterium TaxID=2052148 RepID=A0A7V3ZW26_UNCW3